MRVIIIGSGIAGLSAAIALRKVGQEVALYERAPELREVGAGISLWANAMRALDHIGAGDSVRERSLRMIHSEMRVREGRKVQVAMAAEAIERRFKLREFVRLIHRADLVAALSSHLPPGVTRYGHECVGVEVREKSAQVRFQNGQTDEAEMVIGADGIRSVIRTAILGPEEPRYSGYTCWRGICPRPANIETGYVGEWWGRGQRLGITTIPGDRVYWFAVKNAPPNTRHTDNRTYLQEVFANWAEPAQTLFAATEPNNIIHSDIIDRPPVRNWSKGCVGIMGDAAHPTTPNLGQGGCIAIEDAVALARQLATGAEPARAWEAFTAERYPRTKQIVQDSWQFGQIAQKEGRLTCWLRDMVMALLMKLSGSNAIVKNALFDIGPLSASQPYFA